ncbi:MAG: ClC family H(+)/Cl(-) exchange transporter [Cyanobacteria bacterium P01_H01_bin.15]
MSQRDVRSRYLPFIEAAVIGLMAGGTGFLFQQVVGWIGSIRVDLAHHSASWLTLPLMGLTCGYISGLLVVKFAPEASGSGIPRLKGILHGHNLPLTLRTAVVKFLGGVLTLGAGLRLGREGPTVQISAALAKSSHKWWPKFRNYQRQLIAAGAGAGLAAAFNTPIAGLLFVIEELMQDFSNLTLGTAILACFVSALISEALGSVWLGIEFPTSSVGLTSPKAILILVFVGLSAGVLGAMFNRAVLYSTRIQRTLSWGLPTRVAFAGLLSGLVIAILPATFDDSTGMKELIITNNLDWRIAALAFGGQFLLTTIAYGSGAVGGLFTPVLILGGTLGYLINVSANLFPGDELSATYALAGMGAMFSATIRVPITAIVIIFEMTKDFNLILPLMLVSVIAYIVGDSLAPGSLYDRLLEQMGIYLEHSEPSE